MSKEIFEKELTNSEKFGLFVDRNTVSPAESLAHVKTALTNLYNATDGVLEGASEKIDLLLNENPKAQAAVDFISAPANVAADNIAYSTDAVVDVAHAFYEKADPYIVSPVEAWDSLRQTLNIAGEALDYNKDNGLSLDDAQAVVSDIVSSPEVFEFLNKFTLLDEIGVISTIPEDVVVPNF